MATQFLLERREFKYLVPRRQIPALRQAISGACTLDSFAQDGGRYTVRSLYYDTQDLRLFWANEREEPDRFKMRVRCYPGTEAPVFLEVKRRTLDIISKARHGIPRVTWLDHLSLSAPKQGPRHERFVSLLHTYQLQPRILVQYQREAYFSELEDYARVSIDTHIECQEMTHASLEAPDTRWRPIDHRLQTLTAEPVAVVELKFSNAAPRWMVNLVQRLDLIRRAFSKYCYGIRALVPPTRPRRAAGLWG